MSERQLAFVCGLHRSGTSLLARAIAHHPDASGFSNTGVPEDEGQFLQTVYSPARSYGGPGQFGFDPRAHLTERSALVTEENRAKLLAEWGRCWDMEKRVLVEKSPPNLLKTRFLQALFPEAAFVVIIRHPLAVSLATKRHRDLSLSSLLRHWLDCHEIFTADAGHLRRLIVVRYEELITAPTLLTKIQMALGLRPAPLDVYLEPGVNSRYFEEGQTELQLVQGFEERANRFGYSLVSPERADVDPNPDFARMLAQWREPL